MDSNKLARAICSFIVPGLGQLINEKIGRGLTILIVFVILWFVLLFTGIWYIQNIFGIIFRILAAYDAYTYDGF